MPNRLLAASLVFALIAAGNVLAADSGESVAPADQPRRLAAQPGKAAPPTEMRDQPGGDRTLEIAPQPGSITRGPGLSTGEIPAEKAYQPSERSASVDRNYNPGGSGLSGRKPGKLPSLGINVKWTLKCYLGKEEHGLEVLSVDPNSPAQKAGLKGATGSTALGAAGATAGALLGPLELVVAPLLNKAGQLGQGGDLIVAVDDHRVRSELDLEDELAKLKPGDTMYLTVLRALPGGGHRTMRIEVKVGEPFDSAQQSLPSDSLGAEQYGY